MHDWPAGEIFRVRDIQAATGKEHLAAIKVEKEETLGREAAGEEEGASYTPNAFVSAAHGNEGQATEIQKLKKDNEEMEKENEEMRKEIDDSKGKMLCRICLDDKELSTVSRSLIMF